MQGLQSTVTPTRVLGLPQSIKIASKPVKRFRQGFTGAPVATEENENKQQLPLLTWVREAVLGGLPTLLVVTNAKGVNTWHPALNTQVLLWALQKWPLAVFGHFCPEFTPSAHACSYFYLCILLLEEMRVQVQGL